MLYSESQLYLTSLKESHSGVAKSAADLFNAI